MGRISKIEKARAALEQLHHEANKSVLSAEDVETLLCDGKVVLRKRLFSFYDGRLRMARTSAAATYANTTNHI